MTSAEIRRAFLDYFRSKQHEEVASSSLVPHDDPTLLFTNAGMNQFKELFLGTDKRAYSRATTSQKCVRAGGKHNDLENVGYTARHHTFFEMLGNFSFGDYFKQDAIQYAWQFLTEVLQLPQEKLLVTVYQSDDEAFDIWAKQVGVPEDKIIRIGDKSADKPFESDNFWQMGDTGPCGPCTEIFYDHGAHIWGGPPGSAEEDGDRFIEIWNLVFMQYNRQADGSMQPLPRPSVDTGMGLERIAAILQGVHSNYEIDIFQALIAETASLLEVNDLESKSLRVIADHIRSCGFLIADGVMPSNEGRGYVLRRIIRRAVRHGHKLGSTQPFFFKLVAKLIELMGEAYPELVEQRANIEKLLQLEEEQFLRTLGRGMTLLDTQLAELQGNTIPGDVVFKLYDTYGFPADLTADIAREREIEIDQAGFDKAMAEQRERAQKASQFGVDYNQLIKVDASSEFTGYQQLHKTSNLIAIYREQQAVETLSQGETAQLVLDQTAFYAESGGQVGDTGYILGDGFRFKVTDTQKAGSAILHIGELLEGELQLNQTVNAEVAEEARQATRLNHSATHLLHAALRQVLGEHVTQKGSLVNPERLRFDFSHFEALSSEQLRQIEALVNQQIRLNHTVDTQLMGLEEAKAAGAMALFGEKYDSEVRVVQMGGFSTELCGGCHVARSGDIGSLKIISEGGIASGVRRIEAVTGAAAEQAVVAADNELAELAKLLKGEPGKLAEKVKQLLERSKGLEKEVEKLNAKLTSAAGSSLLDSVEEVAGQKLLVTQLDGTDPKLLRQTMDQLKDKLGSGIILLAVAKNDKVSLIAGVTKDLTAKVKAGELVNFVAQQVGGKGGGRPDMAQAGGSDVSALPQALASVKQWLSDRL